MASTDYVGIAALITAAGGTFAIMWSAVKGQRKSEREEESTKPVPIQSPPPPQLEAAEIPDSASLSEVIAIMRTFQGDNVSLREEQRQAHAWRVQAEKRISDLQDEVAFEKSWKVRFLDALGRYLSKIYIGWDHTHPFPLPDTNEDLVLLSDVIPR